MKKSLGGTKISGAAKKSRIDLYVPLVDFVTIDFMLFDGDVDFLNCVSWRGCANSERFRACEHPANHEHFDAGGSIRGLMVHYMMLAGVLQTRMKRAHLVINYKMVAQRMMH